MNINFMLTFDNYSNGFNYNLLSMLSLLCVILSIFTIISKNPISSILFLIGLFISVSIYLILIGMTFIGISYLLVYIGAVSMLFLFILMLIDIRVSELHIQNYNSLFLAFFISMLFYISNFDINDILNKYINNDVYITNSSSWEGHIVENYDIISIGNVLYTNLSVWLIITSLILLLAMVGAIVININTRK